MTETEVKPPTLKEKGEAIQQEVLESFKNNGSNKSDRNYKEVMTIVMLDQMENLAFNLQQTAEKVHSFESSAKTLESAGQSYMEAVNNYTKSSKIELQQFINQTLKESKEKTLDEFRNELQNVFLSGFRMHALDEILKVTQNFQKVIKQATKPKWQTLLESAVGGFVGAICVVALLRLSSGA